MQQAEQEAPQDMPAVAAAAAESSAIVSSSDHDHPVASSAAGGRGAASAAAAAYDSSDDEVGHPGGSGNGGDPLPDPHYDENQDEEDEAWVYRHMRGGRAEEVMMAVQSTRTSTRTRRKAREDEQETTKNGGGETLDAAICGNANDSRRRQQQQRSPAQDRAGARPAPPDMAKVMMLKPRNSDAVLSCPCCFTILCMDCQRHVKYNNQYRAMFVMNIGVAWHKRLRWDEYLGELVEIIGANDASGGADERTMELDSPSDIPNAVPGDSCDEGQPSQKSVEDDPADIKTKTSAGNTRASRTRAHLEGDDETYYSVYCASCNTEVAYLNMDDEVYHFVNCLASG